MSPGFAGNALPVGLMGAGYKRFARAKIGYHRFPVAARPAVFLFH